MSPRTPRTLGQRAARLAYSTAMRLALPALLARLQVRARREPLYGRWWNERLGLGWGSPHGVTDARDAPIPAAPVWVHAVSLGETRAAGALIEAMRRRDPKLRLLLTHGTATGREAGTALLHYGDQQAWLPLDTPGATRRFLRRFRPRVGVLMETEIWPNLLLEAQALEIPMVLANARLSERSLEKGQRFAAVLRPAAESVDLVLAQTQEDAKRLREAGAGRLRVVGNLKFDLTPDPVLVEMGLAWREPLPRPVVLAASTRDGEELALLRAWRKQMGASKPLLLIVPRHPQRFDAVTKMAQDAGFSVVRRSSFGEMPTPQAVGADIWIGDSMGEMPLYYSCADVALLGGSFEPLGGQNLIEAAACGCPVVMGPHTFNFAEAAEQSLHARASLRVIDMAEAVGAAIALARDPRRNEWVERALAFAKSHRGAADRMAEDILRLALAGPGAARED